MKIMKTLHVTKEKCKNKIKKRLKKTVITPGHQTLPPMQKQRLGKKKKRKQQVDFTMDMR